jgi:hypothetical protein
MTILNPVQNLSEPRSFWHSVYLGIFLFALHGGELSLEVDGG